MENNSLALLTEQQLIQSLASCLQMTYEGVRKGAEFIAEIDRRRIDTSAFPKSFVAALRRIAAGQMLPEVMNLEGALRNHVARLPLSQQRRIVSGETVKFVVPDGSGTKVIEVLPEDLEPKQWKQLFKPDRIASESEQKLWIANEMLKQKCGPTHDPIPNYKLVKMAGECMVEINGAVFSKNELSAIINKMS